MANTDKDFTSRNKIISETDKNFFVEAGAGSGKTTMLVNRMVAMVESGIDISKISAITFTKAAAGEFFERFQKVLAERSNPNYVWKDEKKAGQLPAPTEETRKHSAAALQNIDLCFLGTIDAFCNMILSEHPTEAGIPSDTTIISDDEAAESYKALYVGICDGTYGSELAEYSKSFRSVHLYANNAFVEGMLRLMDNRNATFRFTETKAVDFDRDYKTDKKQLLQILKFLVDHPELRYEKNDGSRSAWEALPESYKQLGFRWNTHFYNVTRALRDLQGLRLIPDALQKYEYELGQYFVPHESRGKVIWDELSPDGLPKLLSGISKLKYDISMTFLTKCVPIVEESMKARGKLKFFDYLLFLRDTLKKDAENGGALIRYINERHSYYLIDEFQDTNPMQAEIFFYLTSEKPVTKWDENVPRQGSLFIVGDPKQSIYRFRSADVASFLRVKKLFEQRGGEILELSRNFRSTKKLIEFFNTTFTRMLPAETAEQSRFPEIPVPEERQGEFQGIYTYTAYTGKKLTEEHPDETDPMQIGKIIERLVDRKEYQIYDRDVKSLRPLKYSDFMVITFGKDKLGPIMARLDELEIPTRVEGQVPFEENEALREIVKIFAAVADADDKIALYSALTGIIVGLAEEEILKFRSFGGRLSLTEEQPESVATNRTALKVAARLSELKELYDKARRLTPAGLFQTVMDEFRIYERVEAENLEVVYYTLELLRNAEKAGTVVSLKDGSVYLSILVAGESGEERSLSLNDMRDAVHMANLHKLKGLEAPVVILAAAWDSAFTPDYRIQHGTDGAEGYLFNLSTSCKTEDFEDEKAAEKAALQAETVRQVYVAATRARNVVIICRNKSIKGERNRWKDLVEDALPDFFVSVSERTSEIDKTHCDVIAKDLYDSAETSSVLNDQSSETGTFRIENPSRYALTSKMSEETVESDTGKSEDGTEKKGHLFPALLGTMTHKLMEMLVSSGNGIDVPEAVSEIIREYRTRESEPYEAQLIKTLIKVANTIQHGGYAQENGSVSDILKVLLSADEVHCEVPFCFSESDENESVIWNGVIDVLYRTGTEWHIVDYKTNADGTGLDEKYEAQLKAYQKAFKATTGEEADARIYHIDI
ncbi:MAG: UvrD-helicase domain-containing protein [Clostridiales bacterium]|nr:UvrD-helicase domain-containing protein [Clostridiales bacterium]